MERMTVYGESSGAPSRASTSTKKPPPKRPRPEEEEAPSQVERDDPPPAELDEHFVTFRTDVVGVQYYAGMVGRGEYVLLRRQPENKYDANAVQVINASGQQVGHIPRAVAANLAELMDHSLISVEGRMVGQNLDRARHYKLGMDLSIYARPSLRDVLETELAWATPNAKVFNQTAPGSSQSASGFKGSNSSGTGLPQAMDPAMKHLLDGLTKVSEDEKHADGVMDALTADMDVGKYPLHPSPPGLANSQLLVDILPHQSQALQWMIERENPVLPKTSSDPAVQFWVKQKGDGGGKADYWLNVATRTPQAEAPVLGKGGIIADGMGLGKTLTTLSLVLATIKDKLEPGASRATLIVCPLSVLSNWEKQIGDHVAPGKIAWYTYHGTSKGVTAKTLESYDVILTTYQTVAAELATSSSSNSSPVKGKKAKTASGAGPLFNVYWKRVVADEGHVLKNPKAKMTQAFVALKGDRRWICTGTPIVNSPGDLGSLLTCLRVCKPLDQADYFRTLLLRPLKRGDPAAGKLLQALVGQVLLRRTKDSKDSLGRKLIELPPVEFYRCPVQLDEVTRKLYDEVLEGSRARFEEALTTGEGTANVLSMLTRMRQLCLSAELVPQAFIDDLRRPIQAPVGRVTPISHLPAEKREELLSKLRQYVADETECGVCYDEVEFAKRPSITDCGHAFCYPCIERVLLTNPICPMDRHPLGLPSILELPPDDQPEWEEEDEKEIKPIKSAKIDELVKYLGAFDKDEKTLVFSQFTSFLDHVALRLKNEGVRFVKFDGRMPAKKRQEVIAEFQQPVSPKNEKTNPKVMLISLKSGAVGLNLTAASNVFLCDPWWQSAIEAQAIDRMHRMGQRRTVRVFQLIAENTVESSVLDIQKRKDALIAKAFEKSTKESTRAKKEARFEDLKELFGMK